MSIKKITSLNQLEQLSEELLAKQNTYKTRVLICMTGCRAMGAKNVAEQFRKNLGETELKHHTAIVEVGCIGLCAQAPTILIEPYEYLYGGVKPEDAAEIIDATIRHGKPVRRLSITKNGIAIPEISKVDFYKKQTRFVLKNCGRIDPRRIEDAIERGTYIAAVKTITQKQPEQVIEQVIASGLRGRGGAGFSTGLKWNFCRKSAGTEKYLICNADEGDPGAFMDRALLEGDPHRVIEGMLIAAYAIGASHGFVYVRAEYPIAVEHITIALQEAMAAGLLGQNIAGTDFNFDIQVRMGAGAFVCGEETALIASLEGKRGMPNARPPFPAQSGYIGKPTNINNVETFANVPLIMNNGADWYSSIGTEKSKGTKIFALAGKVKRTGLVEVPMGTTLRQIIYDIGEGIPGDRNFKAAQLGGPSGGCIPARYLDNEIDYDSVQQIGAIMGSGGLIVMDENTCMVDVARYFLSFVQNESCGKCTPCRVGTKKMLHILQSICRGEAKLEDLDTLEKLAENIKKSSLCGLGQTASNPVLSTLRHFRDEYEEHIVLKTCRAAVCKGLVRAPCQHSCPARVNVPEYLALVAEGKLDDALSIIRRRNPFVSVCGRVCNHPCEKRCRRADIDSSLAIRALKRYIADNTNSYGSPAVRAVTTKPEIGIIGSGPAGLSCAYFLALMQRASVIFEAQPIPGGMLTLGIPEFRLPKEVLRKEIDFILSHGIELRTNSKIKNASELLMQGFNAVFIATGAQLGKAINIEGIELDGVIDVLEFLRNRALGKGLNCKGKKIVVLGGGNAAIDAARSAIRLGAEKVTILYRRTKHEMPAYQEEIDGAIDEGVDIAGLSIPKRIVGSNGIVTGIEFIKAQLGKADADGRAQFIPIEGTQTVIECDIVIPAIGQSVSTELVDYEGGPALTSWSTIKTDLATLNTTADKIFAGGDCVTGASTVIEAIAGGQRAAVSIDRLLGGTGQLPHDTGFSFTKPDEETLAKSINRAEEKMLSVESRNRGFAEVVLGLDRQQAFTEACRCLRCDLEK
ncbi:MAG: NADH-quinone oxidoreductase subunit NuoF [Phycisphaerae bacterium]|jgi:NADH-quinone oxidoreductase subunit F